MLKFGTKNACLGYFWAGISKGFGYFWAQIGKESCRICNQYSPVCLIAKFRRKPRCLNHGSNMAYLLFLTNNVLFWNFSARISKTAFAIFEISTLKFLSLQNFAKKNKNALMLGQTASLGKFGAGICKRYCDI